MTIIILNPSHTVMYADSAMNTDGFTTLNDRKIWRTRSGMIIGTSGNMELHSLLDAQNPTEALSALREAPSHYEGMAGLILYDDRAYQMYMNKKDGPVITNLVGPLAIGAYRQEWQNFAVRNGAYDSDIDFDIAASTFCGHVNTLWGMKNVKVVTLSLPSADLI